jgi:SAM-dependent methyltransferase
MVSVTRCYGAYSGLSRTSLSHDAGRNHDAWDRFSDEYQSEHASQLNEYRCVWGTWNIPKDELQVLGDIAGKDILEFGCGAAHWSIGLARRGARPVGLDNSARQLEHGRRLMTARASPHLTLRCSLDKRSGAALHWAPWPSSPRRVAPQPTSTSSGSSRPCSMR